MKKEALVLVNVGTPDQPDTRHVRRYLSEFLNDPLVIDLPRPWRNLLVNLVIVPFRSPRSARLYRRLWTPEGSPLLFHLERLAEKVQAELPGADVYAAMRYGNPSLEKVLMQVRSADYQKITILPLYPHYATSTTGSVEKMAGKLFPGDRRLTVIPQFWNHPAWAEVMTRHIAAYQPDRFDHVLFSYHGLPIRQVQKVHPERPVKECPCTHTLPEHGEKCYLAGCHATSRMLAERLRLEEGGWSTAFQSRLSRNWHAPFTDETLVRLAGEGKTKVLLIPASFVADCLETTVEIDGEYHALFREHGGTELVMTPSLNSRSEWASVITQIIGSGEKGIPVHH